MPWGFPVSRARGFREDCEIVDRVLDAPLDSPSAPKRTCATHRERPASSGPGDECRDLPGFRHLYAALDRDNGNAGQP